MNDWNDMSIGQRILQCAYMATREHLLEAQADNDASTKEVERTFLSAIEGDSCPSILVPDCSTAEFQRWGGRQ